MCLSTVYKNTMEESAIVMKNVMRIDCPAPAFSQSQSARS